MDSRSWLIRERIPTLKNWRKPSVLIPGLWQRQYDWLGFLRKLFIKSSSGRLIFQCRLCGEVSPLYGVSRKRNCSNKILAPFVTGGIGFRCRLFFAGKWRVAAVVLLIGSLFGAVPDCRRLALFCDSSTPFSANNIPFNQTTSDFEARGLSQKSSGGI